MIYTCFFIHYYSLCQHYFHQKFTIFSTPKWRLPRFPSFREGHTHTHQCRRTHRHVAGTAGIPRVGQRVHQTTTDTKVAQLDVAVAIQENVGGLHVWRAQRERDGGYWEEQEWETWQVQLLLLNKIFMNYRLIPNFFMAPCTLADRICHEYYALV